MSIVRMCELVTVSRASFYRHWEEKAPTEAEMALRDVIPAVRAMVHRMEQETLVFWVYRKVRFAKNGVCHRQSGAAAQSREWSLADQWSSRR